MKKLTYLFGLGAIASLFIFNSCSEETLPAPSITFDAGTELVLGVGESEALLTGTIVAEAKLDRVIIYQVTDLSETQLTTITDFESGAITTTDDMNYSFRFTVTSLTEDVQIKIEATDKDDQFASKSINIVVSAGGNIVSYTAKILADFNNDNIGSFFSTVDGVVYKQGDAKASANIIDFVYYHGVSNGPTLAAPSESGAMSIYDGPTIGLQTWSTLNNTKFKKLSSFTSSDFDAITNDTPIVENAVNVNSEKANQLQVGDIFAFVTEAGKMGITEVMAITGVANSDGTITIDVKVQQ